jgi:mannan endo-1,4-beta-mannosidase
VYVNEFKSYWLMSLATNPTDRQEVTSDFQHAATHGLTVAGSWAFNNGNTYRALQTSPCVYDEQVFQVLQVIWTGGSLL